MLDRTITLYHLEDGRYVRKVINNTFYYNSASSSLNRQGNMNVNAFTVVINTKQDISINEGSDIIVDGICAFEFNNTSEQTISESMKQLKSAYTIHTVNTVNKNLFGGLSNIQLICK